MKKLIISQFILIFIAIGILIFWKGKPQANIFIDGMEDSEYYVGILTKKKHAININNKNGFCVPNDTAYVQDTFANYEAENGYDTVLSILKCQGNLKFNFQWNTITDFKIVIYIPESKTFTESSVCKRFATECFYIFHMKDAIYDEDVIPNKSYHWGIIVAMLLLKVILMVLISLGLAFQFKYTEKKQLIGIWCTNIVANLSVVLCMTYYCYNENLLIAFAAGIFYLLCSGALKSIIELIIVIRFSLEKVSIGRSVLYSLFSMLLYVICNLILFVYLRGVF